MLAVAAVSAAGHFMSRSCQRHKQGGVQSGADVACTASRRGRFKGGESSVRSIKLDAQSLILHSCAKEQFGTVQSDKLLVAIIACTVPKHSMLSAQTRAPECTGPAVRPACKYVGACMDLSLPQWSGASHNAPDASSDFGFLHM